MKQVRTVWMDLASSQEEAEDLTRRAYLMIILREFLGSSDPEVVAGQYGFDLDVVANIKTGRIDLLPLPLLERVMAAIVRITEGRYPPPSRE